MISYKGRNVYVGMKVCVYVNLNNHSYSIRSAEKGLDYGKVIGHAQNILLKDCQFIIQPKGLQRVRRNRVRNVIAWVEGIYINSDLPSCPHPELTSEVNFRPFENDYFFDLQMNPVQSANRVFFQSKRAYIAA